MTFYVQGVGPATPEIHNCVKWKIFNKIKRTNSTSRGASRSRVRRPDFFNTRCFILIQSSWCVRVCFIIMLYTLVSKARLLLSFSPKYCAEALRPSLSWDVNLGGGLGCALRFRWAPHDSGSCTDRQAVIWSFPKKTSHTRRLIFKYLEGCGDLGCVSGPVHTDCVLTAVLFGLF